MKVGIDGRALQPGFKQHLGRGIGQYAVELLRALARRDDLEIAAFVDPALPLDPSSVPAGVAVRRFPRAPFPVPWRGHWTTQAVLPFAVRATGVDVFHVLAHGDAPAIGAPRLVVTVHDLILEVLGRLYRPRRDPVFAAMRALERAAIRRASGVIVDSAHTGADLERVAGIAAARIHVAHLGVNERFRPRGPEEVHRTLEALGLERPYLLYLGGFDARKNVAGLLRAYARVRAASGGVPRLVLAGPLGANDAPNLKELLRTLGLEGAVELPGHVDDAHVPALLSGAELFVFPSLYEGFGLPPLEAMACGAPVVASDGGSLAEVLGDGAQLVPAGDDARFADAMLEILGSKERAETLAARGRAHAERFTWDATAAATVAAYRAAADRA